MKTIVIASNNPVKVKAVLLGFVRMFPGQDFETVTTLVASNVSDQPITDEETYHGAFQRAINAKNNIPDADFWVGVEGGIEDSESGMSAFAWVVILSPDHHGRGRTGTFYLPLEIANLIRQGVELGDADDIVFGINNSKQKNGAIGLLTGNVIDRTRLYEQAVILALLPFKNPALYPKSSSI